MATFITNIHHKVCDSIPKSTTRTSMVSIEKQRSLVASRKSHSALSNNSVRPFVRFVSSRTLCLGSFTINSLISIQLHTLSLRRHCSASLPSAVFVHSRDWRKRGTQGGRNGVCIVLPGVSPCLSYSSSVAEGCDDWWIPRGSQVRSLFPVNPPIVFQGTRTGYCVTGGGCYAAANKHEFAEFWCFTLPRGRDREEPRLRLIVCTRWFHARWRNGGARYILDIKDPVFICFVFFLHRAFLYLFFSFYVTLYVSFFLLTVILGCLVVFETYSKDCSYVIDKLLFKVY